MCFHPDKTHLVEFGRFAAMKRRQRGAGKPQTFDFLGFTHQCTTTRRGRFRLGRKPVAKRVKRTLARIEEVLRKRWHHDIWAVGEWLGGLPRLAELLCRSGVEPVPSWIPPQVATPVDAGAMLAVSEQASAGVSPGCSEQR